ncbi:PfkB family carbohydrate kinase [Pseudonocardia sp. KRD291]|uniref:PfkB family carbohydrate kinase n=1 Tax=Pseudonocardia sp. KRD291 TaxID=2792007 RepID=UPI001C4A5947|nr:PfkB family carbohydrate kinase [Pseudonocardia sp. KRD291]MBW0101319.1 bifunctional heptose 7-phosphate kinase/heptose 1-phosphate adenyltransferase [Pseudonocardia sp. KRD291]
MTAVVVLGDVLLDVDMLGAVERSCPDAPAPVVDVAGERARPGGAGLAAVLAAELPGVDRVVLVTALGDDEAGARLARLLAGRVELVALPLRGGTVCKTRVLTGGEVLARLDTGDGRAAPGPVPPQVRRALHAADAVLVSDYGRGVAAHEGLRRALAGLDAGTPVVWDPHPRGAAPVPGARLVTPNRAEARAADPGAGEDRGPDRGVAGLGERLRRHWACDAVAVTVGADGAVLAPADGGSREIPVPATGSGGMPVAQLRQRDTCGAGDMFAAAATAALGAGSGTAGAVRDAVAAAARFVGDGGAGGRDLDGPSKPHPRADRSEPPVPFDSSGPPDPFELADRVRRSGGRVVATGGCFDLLHAGHVALLQAARARGDALVVCLNSDRSVRRRKGPDRPLVPAADRARVLAALGAVDAVAVFDEPDPAALLERLRPDVWVKGGDYEGAHLPEAQVVERHGGVVTVLPLVGEHSTTGLVAAARTGPAPARGPGVRTAPAPVPVPDSLPEPGLAPVPDRPGRRPSRSAAPTPVTPTRGVR